ncbi:MAG: cyclopropane-fatty-acyl-phospholipid synthase family protein [Pseudomonadota bacterium]
MKKRSHLLGIPGQTSHEFHEPRGAVSEGSGAPPLAIERWALRKLLSLLGDPPIHVILWDGEVISAPGVDSVEKLIIRDRATLWRLVINPDLYFGDAYSQGRVEVEGDLVAFLETLYSCVSSERLSSPLFRLLDRMRNRASSGAHYRNREDIRHHYDIGNDFYRLWLDENLVYTCAYYPTPSLSIEQAQVAKMEYICRKLRLRKGDTVVEAGGGWGSLARHMARHYGVTVKSYNISHEQIVYSTERAAREGLDSRIQYIEADYNDIAGRYDVFVSVGMLEHVRPENYRRLGSVIDRCLKENGRGLIHTIGRNRPRNMNAWIERRIFPGACPPSLSQMTEIFEPYSFSVLDIENLRLHYAKTLEQWLGRFDAHAEKMNENFDETFIRAWRLYLAGSIAAFTTGELQLFQVVFSRPRNNDIPWSRSYLYEGVASTQRI